MLFAQLVATSGRVASTSKRLEKVELLAQLLRQLDPDEVAPAVSYLSGAVPQGKTGVGYATLRDAAAEPSTEATLSIADVHRLFQDLPGIRGGSSAQRKREVLQCFLRRATAEEQRFLFGLVGGEIRQGALEGVMMDALAKAAQVNPDRLRRAVMMAGDLSAVARPVLEKGASGLEQFDIQLFRPVQPMLAGSAEDIEAAVAEIGDAALEYKMDGARVQVHRSGDEVRVYSRALNEVTEAVPEIVEAVRQFPAREVILDGEVLSLTPAGRPNPFQVTMRRFGRRLDLERMRAELPLSPFWFDLLYLDGTPLIDEAQSQRFASLSGISPLHSLMPHLRTSDSSKAEEFLKQALESGHEGIMAKAPGSTYAAGSRGQSWLKVKKAHTLDLVVLAAEWGNGRRKGWLSNLHLGARDAEKGGFAMLGKTFKGMTDEMLEWQTEYLRGIEISRDSYTVYVEPKLVVEIAFNDIQISPRYASGLALRFARVKRYRPDKPVELADTFQTVQRMAAEAGGGRRDDSI